MEFRCEVNPRLEIRVEVTSGRVDSLANCQERERKDRNEVRPLALASKYLSNRILFWYDLNLSLIHI